MPPGEMAPLADAPLKQAAASAAPAKIQDAPPAEEPALAKSPTLTTASSDTVEPTAMAAAVEPTLPLRSYPVGSEFPTSEHAASFSSQTLALQKQWGNVAAAPVEAVEEDEETLHPSDYEEDEETLYPSDYEEDEETLHPSDDDE